MDMTYRHGLRGRSADDEGSGRDGSVSPERGDIARIWKRPSGKVVGLINKLCQEDPDLQLAPDLKARELQDVLEFYYYLHDEQSYRADAAVNSADLEKWNVEAQTAVGGQNWLDPVFARHEHVYTRNKMMAWSVALQEAARQDEIPSLRSKAEVALIRHGLLDLTAQEVEELTVCIRAAERFYQPALGKVDSLKMVPAISFECIVEHLEGRPGYSPEVHEALHRLYMQAQTCLDGTQPSGISEFSSLTRMAHTVAADLQDPEVVKAALLSFRTASGHLKPQDVDIADREALCYAEALEQLKREQFHLPKPRDLNQPSYSWHYDSNRFLQSIERIARKHRVAGDSKDQRIKPLSLFVLWAASKKQEVAGLELSHDRNVQDPLEHEMLVLAAPTAERFALDRLSYEIQKRTFQIFHPEQYATTRALQCAVLGMKRSDVRRFIDFLKAQIVSFLTEEADGPMLSPDMFSVSGRLKGAHSAFAKAGERSGGAEFILRVMLGRQYDHIGLKVRFKNPADYELLRHVLATRLGRLVDRSQHQHVIMAPYGHCEIPVELIARSRITRLGSQRKLDQPHFEFKKSRIFNLLHIGQASPESSRVLPKPRGVAFDHIDPPLPEDGTLDRHAYFRQVMDKLSSWAYVRLQDGDDYLSFKLPARARVLDLLASRHGANWIKYAVVRLSQNGEPEKLLDPQDYVAPGETLRLVKAKKELRTRNRLVESDPKTPGRLRSLLGIYHTSRYSNGELNRAAARGEMLLKEFFGELDPKLREDVLEPFRHWQRLDNLTHLREVLGLKRPDGTPLLAMEDLKDWYYERYARVSAKWHGSDIVEFQIDEDQPHVFEGITAIADRHGIGLVEVTAVDKSQDGKPVVALTVDHEAFSGRYDLMEAAMTEFVRSLNQMQIRRGDGANDEFGLKHAIRVRLDASPGSAHALAQTIGKLHSELSAPNITYLKISAPFTEPGAMQAFQHVELEISGPGSALNADDVENRVKWVYEVMTALSSASFMVNGIERPLCYDVDVTEI